ncbi:UNKNOWN [Stylonychia lemnae]|uniref:Uncharacterized protein n=1 Tax=Stylonychia lemnae TaxID=5949 RepID=A0A078AFZ6_STYLE|nr:UNKNOWN [Stylonychia lemnae]|eukprot:CDW81225.1 UNKNOWN [Stylonychia lemnae]
MTRQYSCTNVFVNDKNLNQRASITQELVSKRIRSLDEFKTQLNTIMKIKEPNYKEIDKMYEPNLQRATNLSKNDGTTKVTPILSKDERSQRQQKQDQQTTKLTLQQLKDERIQLKIKIKELIIGQKDAIYLYEMEKVENERLLYLIERLKVQKFHDDMRIVDLTKEIEMNTDLMSGFSNANFILKSRTEVTNTFVDDSKKTIERIRQSRITQLSDKLRELHQSIEDLENLKNDYIVLKEKINKAEARYDVAHKERIKYDQNVQNKGQIESQIRKRKELELEKLVKIRDMMKSDQEILKNQINNESEFSLMKIQRQIENKREDNQIMHKKNVEVKLREEKYDSQLKIFYFKLIQRLQIIKNKVGEYQDITCDWQALLPIQQESQTSEYLKQPSRQQSGAMIGGGNNSPLLGARKSINQASGLMNKFRNVIKRASIKSPSQALNTSVSNSSIKPKNNLLIDFLQQSEIDGYKQDPKYQQNREFSMKSSSIAGDNSKANSIHMTLMSTLGKGKYQQKNNRVKFVQQVMRGNINKGDDDSFLTDTSDEMIHLNQLRKTSRSQTGQTRSQSKLELDENLQQMTDRPQTQSLMRMRKQQLVEKRNYLKQYVQTISNLHREEDQYLQRFKALSDPYLMALTNPQALQVTKKTIMGQLKQMKSKKALSQCLTQQQSFQHRQSFDSSRSMQRLRTASTKNNMKDDEAQSQNSMSILGGQNCNNIQPSSQQLHQQQKKKLADMKIQRERTMKVKQFLKELEVKVQQKQEQRQAKKKPENQVQIKDFQLISQQVGQNFSSTSYALALRNIPQLDLNKIKSAIQTTFSSREYSTEKINIKRSNTDMKNLLYPSQIVQQNVDCDDLNAEYIIFKNKIQKIDKNQQNSDNSSKEDSEERKQIVIKQYYEDQHNQRKIEKERNSSPQKVQFMRVMSSKQYLNRVESVIQDQTKQSITSRGYSRNFFRNRPFTSKDFKFKRMNVNLQVNGNMTTRNLPMYEGIGPQNHFDFHTQPNNCLNMKRGSLDWISQLKTKLVTQKNSFMKDDQQ